MIFNNSKLSLIILALASLILLAILTLGVYDIQAKNRKASELLNLANQAAEARTLARSIRMMQDSAAEDLTTFDNLTLSDDKLVPLIEEIEWAGRALGLDTSIVSVGKIEDKKSIEPDIIRIVMETQGSWTPTFSFLRAIESLPHRVTIEESSLSKTEFGWRSKIVLSLYSFN